MNYEDALKMLNNSCTIITFKNKEEWLKLRRDGIGGSDTSAILGINKWKSPLDIYNDKISDMEPVEVKSKAAEFGNEVEDAIATIFQSRYKDRYTLFLFKKEMFRNKKYTFLQASIDGLLYDHLLKKWGVLEIKTAQDKDYSWQNMNIPDSYYTQGIHYMSVIEQAEFVVYFGLINYNYDNGKDMACRIMQPRIIFKSDCIEDINYQLEKMNEFWGNTCKRIPPSLMFKF